MIAIGFDVEMKGLVSKRALRSMRREAMKRTGAYWQQKQLPKHFQPGAATRYRYKRRNSAYQERKRRKGERRPLVFTGQLKELMMRRQIVRPYPTRATINIPGPSYLSMRPKGGNKPNLGEEVTRVNSKDEDKLTQIHDQELQKLIDSHKPTKRKKVR